MTSLSTSWKQHYCSLAGDEEGNKTMLKYSLAIAASVSERERLLALCEDVEAVIFIADDAGKIKMIHSPKNFGGTRSRPENKIACMIGMGSLATARQLAKSRRPHWSGSRRAPRPKL